MKNVINILKYLFKHVIYQLVMSAICKKQTDRGIKISLVANIDKKLLKISPLEKEKPDRNSAR